MHGQMLRPADFYIYPGVAPGNYRLSVEVAGIEKSEGTLTLQVRQRVVIDLVMALVKAPPR
jgi:hypothetical protein